MTETWSLPSYGITFNTNVPDDTGCRYFCTKDSGWRGGAAPRTNRDGKPSGLGQFRRATKPTGLVCSIDGEYYGRTDVARAAAERKLARIGKDTESLVEVRCLDAVGELFSMMELDAQTLAQPDNLTDGVFSLQFASPDPRRYGVGQTIGGTTGLPAGSGGLDWVTGGGLNWVPGLDWGTVTSTGQVTFENTPGTAPTDPVFTISCPSGTLINPTVTSVPTGQRLRYVGTMTAGDVLRIDTSEFTRSVVLNGGQDVRTRLQIAEWFQLPVGLSTVSFTSDSINAAATLVGSAFIAYW